MRTENEISENEKQLIKSRIEHEDSLTSNRISWLLGIEALLLNVYYNLDINIGNIEKISIISIGLISTFVISVNIRCGLKSIAMLRKIYQSNETSGNHTEFIYCGYQMGKKYQTDTKEKITTKDFFLHLLVPFIFLVFWLYLLIMLFSK